MVLQGQRLRYSMKIMLTLILYCDTRTTYLIGSASTACRFLIMNIIFSSSSELFFRDCCSFTSKKLYVFLEYFFCINLAAFLGHLPNLKITVGIDNNYLKFHPNIAGNVGQSNQLPDYRGSLTDVFNCQSGMWPACATVSPCSLQGVARWETLGMRLVPKYGMIDLTH